MSIDIKHIFTLTLVVMTLSQINAQADSITSRLSFEADFRFRVEQDWKSRKSDGTFRDDRTRLRYRLRTGATYKKDWYSFGFRIRTGDQKKQQDPQLTLGKGFEEFGTLPIGFEKVFFHGNYSKFTFWLGKNSFPFDKNNELFWSDNVFPEGVFVGKKFDLKFKLIDKIFVKGGHFILSSSGKSILSDAYFQGIQTSIDFTNQWLKLFPSMYLFKNIPNIPDGNHSYKLNYSIFHLGGKLNTLKSKKLFIDFDLYQNIEDYNTNSNISDEFVNEKTGYTFGLQYGFLKKAKDWQLKITYASMQKYAALDYMAQNDWGRWDYSSFDSPDGRLTNFRGVELVAGYNLTDKINIIAKFYTINQLIPTGLSEENGHRIRFDLNVKI